MKKLFLLFFCFTQIHCNKDSNSLKTEPTITIHARLAEKEGIEVFVSRAFSPNAEFFIKDFDNQFNVNNATVALWTSEKELFKIPFDKDARYFLLPTNWQPKVGENYKIIVDVPDYGQAESELVAFPEEPQLNKFDFEFLTKENKVANITIDMENNNKIQKYYCINQKITTKDGSFIYLNQELLGLDQITSETCGISWDNNNICFTAKCLINNQFNFLLHTTGTNDKQKEIKATKIDLRVDGVSESLNKMQLNRAAQISVDTRFQEMPTNYSNIKNGIGCFFAVNEGEKILTILP